MIKSNPAQINSIICTAGTNKVHNIRLNSIFNMFSLPHDIIEKSTITKFNYVAIKGHMPGCQLHFNLSWMQLKLMQNPQMFGKKNPNYSFAKKKQSLVPLKVAMRTRRVEMVSGAGKLVFGQKLADNNARTTIWVITDESEDALNIKLNCKDWSLLRFTCANSFVV